MGLGTTIFRKHLCDSDVGSYFQKYCFVRNFPSAYFRGNSLKMGQVQYSHVFSAITAWYCVSRWSTYLNEFLSLTMWNHICCCHSVAQSCPTLCYPMDSSTPSFPVLHHPPELAQTHVHWFSDAIQPFHPVILFSPTFKPSQHQVFSNESALCIRWPSIGASASASILPMNIHGWYPLGSTSLISLQSKGLSRVFSSTTVWRHQFFSAQTILLSSCHIHTWLLVKP